ncbi:MAG: methionyl-tRNA formyltransferase [Granulosicoccus sp.]|nr:methionyl-tRNA formyltransferase [Granulosicoccus sp.]
MNCRNLQVAFAGTPEFAAVALDALIASSHDVVGVLTQPDRPAGRGRKLTPSAVKLRAEAAGIVVQQPSSLRNAAALAELAALHADVLVVAAYGLLLPQAVLELPALGCLNIHASLLPRWRGAAPIHRAVLAGDACTGVSIMQMDAGLDTGDVLLERRLEIGADETVAELHDRLATLGAGALLAALPGRCDGSLQPVPQSEEGASYAQKLTKAEAALDFAESSQLIHRKVRAFNPWPVAEAELCGERVRIWQSRAVEHNAGTADEHRPGTIVEMSSTALLVRTGDGLLELLQLQWPGKKVQDAGAFAQGRNLVGERFNAT